MNTLTSSSSFLHSLYSLENPNFTKTISQTTLSFRSFTKTHTFHHKFKLNYKLPKGESSSSQVSDTEEDDEDDDEEEAADEYEGVVVAEFEDDDDDVDEDDDGDENVVVVGESKSGFEEFKWQRIERIRNDVREYGDGIIDVDELASVYNFRIDKFQQFKLF